MDILKEIHEIHLMPHDDLRDKKVYHLYKYLQYLYHSGQIDKTKYEVTKKMIGCKPMTLNIPKNDQYESLYLLTCLYDEILNNAKEYTIQQIESPKINIDECMDYAIEFFKYMNVYNLYKEIIDNNLLSFGKNNLPCGFLGTAYDLNNGKSGIVVENNSDISTLITLVHEMGHVYDFYLNKDFPKRKPYSFERECLSITFEYLFLEFLRKNKLFNTKILKSVNIERLGNRLTCMDAAHVFNNYCFDYNCIIRKKIIISTSTLEKVCTFSSTVPKSDYEYYTMKFRGNLYAYGLLFALVMKERFRQDEKETRKYLEAFPSFVYNHSRADLIKSIPNEDYISITNKYIEKTLTKTK